MIKTTLKIEGMACGMCEAHICDTIRNTVPDATRIKASRSKKEASFESENPADEAALKAAIDATGYTFVSMSTEKAGKKGLFGLGHRD